ncbi:MULTISPECIES: GIY-YIG nuclease family protein [Caballeronia]|uniref:DUF4041 domain-containing protein n=2 Tax=Caballeronia TaxID=1827195 RepID=A0ACB5QQ57_9BURK|nr:MULTISPECIES: GIY-YIG nuclease family protein [Caballeronia]GJH12639.1 DUF4041 domain-containing protein [Caballeronia novacaledonica]GJH17208.1 DUF4041 domain-containing protein [Caballeronia novacaledonica]
MKLTLVVLLVAVTLLLWRYIVARKAASVLRTERDSLTLQLATLQTEKRESDASSAHQISTLNEKLSAAEADRYSLARFVHIRDTAAEAERIKSDAAAALAAAQSEGAALLSAAQTDVQRLATEATADTKQKRAEADQMVSRASAQAAKVIDDARKRAEEIAGDALRAVEDADRLSATAAAMKNVIEGYGDAYMVPAHSLLDELADSYSHTEAGKQLKLARDYSKLMAAQNRAADCDYVEKQRRETAIRFVVDAFNGKTDSILSRAKVDNFGTLQQEIKDASALVNHNGAAFRSARILKEYVDARIEELVWAVRTNELREREKEEQRAIREQMREEEKARREYERAMRDAAKEEELIRKAMEKAQGQIARASEEQKAQFEAQLAELAGRLQQAEEKNQRALSMAQQTRAGHVYIISNIGSFGDHVYKVGLTRRLEPMDRVRELGDASVPFSFDVHAMIWSDNAPELEHTLHQKFLEAQVNKVNPRKEFFRVGLADLRATVEEMGLNVSWTMTAAAAEYRESLVIARQIEADPAQRDKWFRRQIALDAAIADEEAGEAEVQAA